MSRPWAQDIHRDVAAISDVPTLVQSTWPSPGNSSSAAGESAAIRNPTSEGNQRNALDDHRQPARNGTGVEDRVSVNRVQFIRPPDAPQSALRNFEAPVEGWTRGADDTSVIGSISGCLSWLSWLPEVTEDSRRLGGLLAVIEAAIEIGAMVSTDPELRIEAVLIVKRAWLEPEWRGHGLGRWIAEQLIDLLLLTPETTLVVAYLNPDSDAPNAPGTGPDSGSSAMPCSLQDAYADAGFEQWRDSAAWWLRPRHHTGEPR